MRQFNSSKTCYWGVLIYGFIVLIDPTNSIMHLKILSFLLCMGLWFCFSSHKVNDKVIFPILFVWIMLIYGNIVADIRFESYDLDYKAQINNLAILTLLLLPLYQISSNKILKMNINIGIALAAFILVFYFLYMYTGLSSIIYGYFTDRANGTIMIAWRETLGIKMLMFFHKASPFLLIPLSLALTITKGYKRIILTILLALPIILGGSRTPILCCLSLIGYLWFCHVRNTSTRRLFFIIAIIVVGMLIFNLISEAQSANEMKFGAADSYLHSLTSSIPNLLIGKGIGGEIYIPGRGFEPNSELSIFDLFNQYGIIAGVIFLFFLLYPAYPLIKSRQLKYRGIGVAYLLYNVVASTNPLLFSSTGWYVWAMIYTISYKSAPLRNFNKDGISLYRYI